MIAYVDCIFRMCQLEGPDTDITQQPHTTTRPNRCNTLAFCAWKSTRRAMVSLAASARCSARFRSRSPSYGRGPDIETAAAGAEAEAADAAPDAAPDRAPPAPGWLKGLGIEPVSQGADRIGRIGCHLAIITCTMYIPEDPPPLPPGVAMLGVGCTGPASCSLPEWLACFFPSTRSFDRRVPVVWFGDWIEDVLCAVVGSIT